MTDFQAGLDEIDFSSHLRFDEYSFASFIEADYATALASAQGAIAGGAKVVVVQVGADLVVFANTDRDADCDEAVVLVGQSLDGFIVADIG